MPVGDRALARPVHHDLDGLGDLGVTRHGHHRRGVERRESLSRNAIGGNAALAQPLVAPADDFGAHTRLFGDGDLRLAGGMRRTVVQAAQPAQRGEAPDFVAAVRDLERVHVEGGEQLPLVQRGKRRPLDRFGQIRH